MRFTCILFFFLLSFPTAVFANDDASKDTLRIKYNLSSDWNISSGNLNSFVTQNRGTLDLEKRVFGVKTMVMYRYGTLNGVENANEFNSLVTLSLFPRNKFYGFVNGGVESSFLRGFNLRSFGGAGVTWRALNSDKHKLEPFTNLMYEFTRFKTPIIVNEDTTNNLNTLRAVVGWTGTHKMISGKFIITHGARFQQSTIDINNFRVESNVSIAIPIIKILSVKTGATYTYENVVLPGRQNSDFVWTFGIALSNI